jgi:hypothetical protein
MAAPTFETEACPQDARCHVVRDERSLDRERAGAAQRVDEARVARGGDRRPPGPQQHGRCQILLERRRPLRAAIAAPVQAVAREVDCHRGDVAVDVQVDAHVGRGRVHRGPAAALLPELVDDGVFRLERRELRVREHGATKRGVDRERTVGAQMRAPVDAAHAGIELLGCGRRKARKRQQHAIRNSRPQARLVSLLERCRTVDAGASDVHEQRAGVAQLLGMYPFATASSTLRDADAVMPAPTSNCPSMSGSCSSVR